MYYYVQATHFLYIKQFITLRVTFYFINSLANLNQCFNLYKLTDFENLNKIFTN